MKLKFWYVILFLLFIFLFGVVGFIIYYRNFYSLDSNEDDIVKLWGSYRSELFNYNDDKLIDYSDDYNLFLNINEDSINMCYVVTNECVNVKYKKDGNKLIINTDDSGIKAAKLEFYYYKDKDGKGLIKMFRKHYAESPDVYSVFYFTDTLG